MYDYLAKCVDVHDGDTFKADINLGLCHHAVPARIRLAGSQAAELTDKDPTVRQRAVAALAFLRKLLFDDAGNPRLLYILTEKDAVEKYGRWLGDVYVVSRVAPIFYTPLPEETLLSHFGKVAVLGDPRSASRQLIEAGLAVPWDGTGPRPAG